MKRALAVAAALACVACGVPALMKLPEWPHPNDRPGAGVDVSASEATAHCHIRTLTAEIAVGGTVGGKRTRGRLLAGFADGAIRFEAVAPFGPPVFIFAASGMRARWSGVLGGPGPRSTLVLPRDNRVLDGGDPGDVLRAVTGIDVVDPASLEDMFTGCPWGPVPGPPTRLSDGWVGQKWGEAGFEVYSHRAGGTSPWRVLAIFMRDGTGPRWRAEYRDHEGGLPRSIRLVSIAALEKPGVRFDLTFKLSQVEINVPLGPDVFTVRIPPTADPMTLQELRQSGPFAAPASDGR